MLNPPLKPKYEVFQILANGNQLTPIPFSYEKTMSNLVLRSAKLRSETVELFHKMQLTASNTKDLFKRYKP